jgi:anti-anti-sigma regulatory factor
MKSIKRSVAVEKMPRVVSAMQGKVFLRELQRHINAGRPLIVLDCSNLYKLDDCIVYVLLCCLEEAMKCNGDVKLAALPSDVVSAPYIARLNRIFDIYNTTSDAVSSFPNSK